MLPAPLEWWLASFEVSTLDSGGLGSTMVLFESLPSSKMGIGWSPSLGPSLSLLSLSLEETKGDASLDKSLSDSTSELWPSKSSEAL